MKRISLTPPILPDWVFYTPTVHAFEVKLENDVSAAYEITDTLGYLIGGWGLSDMFDEYYFDDASINYSKLNTL